MKSILFALGVLLLVLQYEFWFTDSGVFAAWRLKQSILQQQQDNNKLQQRNLVLIADIEDLKSGNEAIEERARNDLGMIKQNETFYRVIQ